MFTQITGFASYLPSKVVNTEDFAPQGRLPQKIDLKRLTKIKTHHEADESESSISMAIEAAKKAIARSKIELSEIDLVIYCAVSKMNEKLEQLISPSMASVICDELGINVRSFDVANACSGMVTGLMIANSQVQSEACKNALVLSGEYLSPALYEALSRNLYLNKKAIPSLTIGDAGCAYVISESNEQRINFYEPVTLSKYDDMCIAEAAKGMKGPAMRTDGRGLQKAGLTNLGPYFRRNITPDAWDEYSHVISHQTSPRAVGKGANIAGSIFGTPEKVRSTDHAGNTASTTHGVVLENLLSNNSIQGDQRILLVAFGSGLSMIGVDFMTPKGAGSW